MFLGVCNDNIFFFFSHTKYLNILCYFVIFLCVLLCLIIKNKGLFNLKHNALSIKIMVTVASFAFLLFLLLMFVTLITASKYEGCYCSVPDKVEIDNKIKLNSQKITDITLNKVIIVGDSRMEFIEEAADDLNIPINFSFIAKSGATIDWFSNIALPELKTQLDNMDTNYTYHVVINMGVNDFNFLQNVNPRANEYFSYYQKLAFTYPEVKFYMLSVNPVFDNIYIYRPTNKRTNEKINTFNSTMNQLVHNSSFKNMYTCDSNHSVDFDSPDGLHYDINTDQRILDYIANKCVQYE